MTATAVGVRRRAAPAPPRVLTDAQCCLDEHLARHGPLPLAAPEALLALIEASGLTGRGRAGVSLRAPRPAVAVLRTKRP
jgi:hypothetical protein